MSETETVAVPTTQLMRQIEAAMDTILFLNAHDIDIPVVGPWMMMVHANDDVVWDGCRLLGITRLHVVEMKLPGEESYTAYRSAVTYEHALLLADHLFGHIISKQQTKVLMTAHETSPGIRDFYTRGNARKMYLAGERGDLDTSRRYSDELMEIVHSDPVTLAANEDLQKLSSRLDRFRSAKWQKGKNANGPLWTNVIDDYRVRIVSHPVFDEPPKFYDH